MATVFNPVQKDIPVARRCQDVPDFDLWGLQPSSVGSLALDWEATDLAAGRGLGFRIYGFAFRI